MNIAIRTEYYAQPGIKMSNGLNLSVYNYFLKNSSSTAISGQIVDTGRSIHLHINIPRSLAKQLLPGITVQSL